MILVFSDSLIRFSDSLRRIPDSYICVCDSSVRCPLTDIPLGTLASVSSESSPSRSPAYAPRVDCIGGGSVCRAAGGSETPRKGALSHTLSISRSHTQWVATPTLKSYVPPVCGEVTAVFSSNQGRRSDCASNGRAIGGSRVSRKGATQVSRATAARAFQSKYSPPYAIGV